MTKKLSLKATKRIPAHFHACLRALAGSKVRLSEQELVDCAYETSTEDCCDGCEGGLMDPAFDFIVANGGVDTEEDYMYWGAWSWGCNK